MYKVFIENRPIIFTEKNTKKQNSYLLHVEFVESIEKELLPILQTLPLDQELIVICENAAEEMERLFLEYEKISAAGGIVQRKKKILFIKRNGFWDIPKGKMEVNESPETCALREIEEECGISGMHIMEPLIETYHTYTFKGKPVLKKTFWFILSYNGTKDVVGQKEEGITDVKWLSLDEIEKVRKKTFASINEVLNLYLDFLRKNKNLKKSISKKTN